MMKNKLASLLRSFFTVNIGYKVAALLIGLLVWALLSNTEDPIRTKDLMVPVTYLYEEKLLNDESLCVLSAPATARITVQVRNSNLSKIKADMFSCTADLMSHSGGDLSAQLVHIDVVQVDGDDMILDWSYYKSDPNVTVALDEYIEKSFYVGLRTVNSLPDGLLFGGSQDFEPGTVTVSGPKTKFGNLASVKATADLNEIGEFGTGFFELELSLQMFDSNENVISNSDGFLTLSASTAKLYSVLIRESTIAVRANATVGTPADGNRVLRLTTEPEIIEVNGVDSSLAGNTELVIPAELLDVSGIYGNTSYEIDVAPYLPEGVTAVGSSLVTVSVEMEAMETMTLSYTAADFVLLEEDENYLYEIPDNPTVRLILRGYAEDLANVSAALYQPVLNVSGISEGRNRVRIQLTELPGVTVENADSLLVTVIKTAKEPESTEPSTEETEETISKDSSEEPTEDTGSEESTETGTGTETEGTESETGTQASA